jgi:isopropylmalate/homocitrate/citramalate synthase
MDQNDCIYDWNLIDAKPAQTRAVRLDDETLRDGLQSPSVRNPTIEEKVAILRLMERLGIHKVDLGLPGAGPFHRTHIEELLKVIVSEKMRIRPGCAVRTVVTDIEPIADLQQRYGLPIQASAFLGTSPIRQYVEDWSLPRLMETMEGAVRFAVSHQIPVMFVTEDTTRSHPDVLEPLYLRAIELGTRAICVCDTVGHATPHGVGQLLRYIRRLVDTSGADVEVNWHGHSDRGLAMANCLAAIDAGADVIHGTALGIGERVGNAQMDQLLVNLKLLGLHDHDLSCLAEYCQAVSRAVGHEIPRNYPVFGQDAFETATGVHAAAVIKAFKKGDHWLADRIYSGVPAGDFGLKQVIKIGPMSGRSNVIHWLTQHGVNPTDDLVNRIFETAKSSPQILEDEQINAIVAGQS